MKSKRYAYVAPFPGSTLRYPAGHPKQGQKVPQADETPGGRGTRVELTSYWVRRLRLGDAMRVKQLLTPADNAPVEPIEAPSEPPKASEPAFQWPGLSTLTKSKLIEVAKAASIDYKGLTAEQLRSRLKAAKAKAQEG